MNDSDNRPICLEGNAGCGKTTCAESLATQFNGILLREYTETMDGVQQSLLRESFDRKRESNNYLVWESAERYRLDRVAMNASKTFILDTSLVSVITFERARVAFDCGGDLPSLVSGYIKLLASDSILLPSKMILLYASEAVRQKRLSTRGEFHPFLYRQDVSDYLARQRAEFFNSYIPREAWAMLDTSNLSICEANDKVAELSANLKSHDLQESFSIWLSKILHDVI